MTLVALSATTPADPRAVRVRSPQSVDRDDPDRYGHHGAPLVSCAVATNVLVIGAMGIVGLVGELVVLAMVGHPLDQRTLDGGGAQRGEHEAHRAALDRTTKPSHCVVAALLIVRRQAFLTKRTSVSAVALLLRLLIGGSPRRPTRRAVLLTAAALVASALPATVGSAAPSAGSREPASAAALPAHIYWTNPETSRGAGGPGIETVARANIDGTGIDKSFITKGPSHPDAIAVNAHFIYWVQAETGAIARADLNGTHVSESFVRISGTTGGLAISSSYIYWASGSSPGSPAEIGRANLNGTHVDARFISVGPGTYIGGLAVDSTHIYWTNRDKGTLGEADLNGSHVDLQLIKLARDPNGLAVEQDYLYWANDPTGGGAHATIGRGRLDGSHVQESFIGGVREPFGVAADAHELYWANYGSATIGRASLGGTHVDQSFIAAGAKVAGGESAPMGVALGPGLAPPQREPSVTG